MRREPQPPLDRRTPSSTPSVVFRVFLSLFFCVLLWLPTPSAAQIMLRPTPPPLITAVNEAWFLSGEPITWAGDYYYQTGPQVYFNGDHMVRSGSYRGIPLYTDAGTEPYSIVFVPVGNGLMQPYERRRTGELAGTTGSRTPSFPVDTPTDTLLRGQPEGTIGRAGAPPMRARPYDVAPVEPEVELPPPPAPPIAEALSGTAGRGVVPMPPRSAARPAGINGVWVDYRGTRWFSAGPARLIDDEFTKAGTYHGFPVYTRRDMPRTIYIPSVPGLVAPYSSRRQPQKNSR